MALSVEQVAKQLRDLGVVEGGVLLVHTSFAAIRPIDGGPRGLIDALIASIGPRGTLVMPSWTEDDDSVFDPLATRASCDLGIVAETFWRIPGVVRSPHPFACSAFGPLASSIASDESIPIPPHIPRSPVGRVHELGGQVLLLGVRHTSNTTLHLAELIHGCRYSVMKHITAAPGKVIKYRENDHCGQGFARANDWLASMGLQREGPVGHGLGKLAFSKDIVRVALENLERDPFVFLHPAGSGCAECDESRAGGPV